MKLGIVALNKERGKLKIDFYYIFLCLVWAKGVLSDLVRAVFMRLPLLGLYDGYLMIYIIYTISFLLAFSSLMQYQRGLKTIIPLLLGLTYLITYFLFPQNTKFLDENFAMFFISVLPMMYLGFAWDTDRVMKMLYTVSVITILCSVVYKLFVADSMSTSDAQYAGDMNLAYKFLPYLCLVGYYALIKSNFFNIILTVVGAIFLFSLGTRGAVLCFIVFMLLVVLLISRRKKKVIWISLITAAIGLLFTGNRLFVVLDFLETIARKAGLSFRIIDHIRTGAIFESSGRDVIQSNLLESLNGHELWGYGLFGDRLIAADTYAHNIIIELMVGFGVFMGIVLFIALVVLIIGKYRKCRNVDQKAFVLVLVCSAVVKLMFSGSYLEEPTLFLLIGICLTKPSKKPFLNKNLDNELCEVVDENSMVN